MKKKIITWGDSITVGMAMRNEDRYPSVLQNLLGSNYEVFNAGSSGETSYTIAARQGAITVYTGKEIVFAKGEATVTIGDENNNGIVLADGTSLNLNDNAFRFNDLPIDEVYIDGATYTFNKKSGEFTLTRTDTSKDLVIAKGEKVEFSSAKNQSGSYCEIFYVGANDIKPWITPTKAQIDELVDCYKKMIERHGNDCYLVVIPHWTSAYDSAFTAAFGDKAVNFRTAAASSQSGKVPQSLLFSTDAYEVHLNADGYKLLAELLHKKGQELHYWE